MAELVIDHIGAQGDAVASENGDRVYVPFALPGEKVLVEGKGQRRELVKIIDPSPDRIEPICSHFGTCGGCQLQHFEAKAYQKWKHSLVTIQLQKNGIDFPVDPLITFEDASRRRCVFNVQNTSEGVILGFAERSSDRIVSLKECPVMVSEISGRIDDLKTLCSSLPQTRDPFRLSVLRTDNGLDLSIEGTNPLKSNIKEVLIRKTLQLGFARLSSDGEILIEAQKPFLRMGMCKVAPPPGSFVQAIQTAEETMVDLVSGHLGKCKSVADLFCGVGTFALRLAEKSKVLAVEENQAALNALDQAWRETGGKLKQIKMEARNLDRRPVGFQELKKIDGLVFDPPRAGAEIQANQIAKSRVVKVAAVSCNPVTLARDLKILTQSGYKISRIVPIDQFKFTAHVEVVVLLER